MMRNEKNDAFFKAKEKVRHVKIFYMHVVGYIIIVALLLFNIYILDENNHLGIGQPQPCPNEEGKQSRQFQTNLVDFKPRMQSPAMTRSETRCTQRIERCQRVEIKIATPAVVSESRLQCSLLPSPIIHASVEAWVSLKNTKSHSRSSNSDNKMLG